MAQGKTPRGHKSMGIFHEFNKSYRLVLWTQLSQITTVRPWWRDPFHGNYKINKLLTELGTYQGLMSALMGGTIMAEVIVIRPVGSKLLLVIRPQVQTVKKTPPSPTPRSLKKQRR